MGCCYTRTTHPLSWPLLGLAERGDDGRRWGLYHVCSSVAPLDTSPLGAGGEHLVTLVKGVSGEAVRDPVGCEPRPGCVAGGNGGRGLPRPFRHSPQREVTPYSAEHASGEGMDQHAVQGGQVRQRHTAGP